MEAEPPVSASKMSCSVMRWFLRVEVSKVKVKKEEEGNTEIEILKFDVPLVKYEGLVSSTSSKDHDVVSETEEIEVML